MGTDMRLYLLHSLWKNSTRYDTRTDSVKGKKDISLKILFPVTATTRYGSVDFSPPLLIGCRLNPRYRKGRKMMKLHAITVPAYDIPSGYDEAPAAYVREELYERLRGAGIDLTGPIAVPSTSERNEDTVTNIAHLGANIAAAVAAGLHDAGNVLVTGSNCNALVGVLAGFEQRYGATAKIGLVWFDAHGDFNTPKTTLSGMIGGMPVAVSAGLAFPHWRAITGLAAPIPTDRIVMVDVRNLDPKERTLIEATDVTIAAWRADARSN